MNVSSVSDINALISSAAGATITPNYISVVQRATVAGDSTARNTKLRAAMDPANATYGGFQDFFYDRLDLSQLSNFLNNATYTPYRLVFDIGVSVLTQLDKVMLATGCWFTAADLQDATTQTETATTGSVMLVAAANSPGYINSYKLYFNRAPDISTNFTTNQLPGF